MLDQLIFPLPTLSPAEFSAISVDLDPKPITLEWLSSFSKAVQLADAEKVLDLFVPNGLAYWRDILALTWDLRTFAGVPKIRRFLEDRLSLSKISDIELTNEEYLKLLLPYPDIKWIQFIFKFSIGDVGFGLGIVRLVPTFIGADIEWKAHSILTTLEELKGFPEKIGHLRNYEAYRGLWSEQRQKEKSFQNENPVVLIVGGGQSGLEVAARLKYLGVSCLVVEKDPRIGGNWRARYSALCLHDPVWYDHMPYLPFPPTWPKYSPAIKMANWLEAYAEALDLNVWTNSTVTQAFYNTQKSLWDVTVTIGQQPEDSKRILSVKHLVFATGFKGGEGVIPTYPGMETFKGRILHSMQHKTAAEHTGKRVVVVGACTSAHDIAADYHDHGIDVTMFQRSSSYIMSTKNGWDVIMRGNYEENGPPTDIADRIVASFPNLMMVRVGQRQVQEIAELDKPLLEGLKSRGFRMNWGYHDAGILLTAWHRGGGYYLDVGASQLIIDGKIKLKNDGQIERFVENGIQFDNGSFLPADVVIFATGLGDSRAEIGRVCGKEALENIKPIFGLDDEGELKGLYRELGIPGLWAMMGNMALCRFHSKHIALQIKAIEENLFGERYSLE